MFLLSVFSATTKSEQKSHVRKFEKVSAIMFAAITKHYIAFGPWQFLQREAVHNSAQLCRLPIISNYFVYCHVVNAQQLLALYSRLPN